MFSYKNSASLETKVHPSIEHSAVLIIDQWIKEKFTYSVSGRKFAPYWEKSSLFSLSSPLSKKKEIKKGLRAGNACSTLQGETSLLSLSFKNIWIHKALTQDCVSTRLLTSFHFYRSWGLLLTSRWFAASLCVFSFQVIVFHFLAVLNWVYSSATFLNLLIIQCFHYQIQLAIFLRKFKNICL